MTSVSGWTRDHPRMRGEKLFLVGVKEAEPGSPPHARGKAIPDAGKRLHYRITPACAGKSAE